MRPGSLLRRRPSPALVISLAALFMSLGGVGYAATQLPNNSVGTSALRNNAVSYKKIQAGAVGYVRANTRQLQERVTKSCPPGSAIGAVNQNGSVNCNSTAQIGTTNNTATVLNSSTTVTSVALPAGASYLAFANPTAAVTSGASAQHVSVKCTLTVGSNTATRTITVDTDGTAGDVSTGSVPLQASGPSGTASVVCQSSGQAPTSVTSAINAIQIAS